MITQTLPEISGGEIAVIGLGRSGVAACELLRARGYRVYACDDGTSPALAKSAAALADRGVTVQTGSHDPERVGRARLVVVSPGVPPGAAPLVAAHAAGRDVISEIELALRFAPDLRYIAVTGTNGKTTTTALIGHLLRALGKNAPDAGNIGTPLSEIVNFADPPDWVALELSSFQLHDTPGVAPRVGVLTNLSADHLDRYASVAEYFADKAMMFRNATNGSIWVVNADDPSSIDIAHGVAGTQMRFSLLASADAWYDRVADSLVVMGRPLLHRPELQLLGDHNVANGLAASLSVMAASREFSSDESRAVIASALRTFRAMPNRLEIAGEWNGVEWINDSKATNVASTLVAIEGMTRPTVLLLGGRHKGEPYTALAHAVKQHVKQIIAFGEAGPIVEQDLAGVAPLLHVRGSFEQVIAAAREAALPGDAVLLSPACSSYDMFNNYVERGARFKALAPNANG